MLWYEASRHIKLVDENYVEYQNVEENYVEL